MRASVSACCVRSISLTDLAIKVCEPCSEKDAKMSLATSRKGPDSMASKLQKCLASSRDAQHHTLNQQRIMACHILICMRTLAENQLIPGRLTMRRRLVSWSRTSRSIQHSERGPTNCEAFPRLLRLLATARIESASIHRLCVVLSTTQVRSTRSN